MREVGYMHSILEKIQDIVNTYANVIAQVLKVDVEIMDSNFKRLAGTGEYSKHINADMTNEGNIYKTVLNSGQTQIIQNPKEHPLCKSCHKIYSCTEKFEMCTPIKFGPSVIGVIGLVCFDENQKDHLLSNFKTYKVFLEQISDLISAKAYAKMENENIIKRINLLNQIIDKIEHGVIVLDKNNYISHMNKNAENILNLSDINKTQLNLMPTGNSFSDHEEYKLRINNEEFLLLGNTYKVNMDDEKYDNIFIFDETKSINKMINTLTNLGNDITLNNILSVSIKISRLKTHILQIANTPSTVLITGESGTGKELFARAIHKLSDRKDNPFIAINCGAIPESLLESELFGYVKGSFTGADPKGKIGKFELADKGTIFLDEIGDMPLYMQVKLLRVLQEREVVKIGSSQPVEIDVRIIAATNKNLVEMIKDNLFREDLYYRLNVIPLEIPSLRDRIEDVKILASHFANKYSKLFNKKFICMTNEVWDILCSYNWPGNVRELENAVEYMINIMGTNGVITTDCIPKRIINNQIRSSHNDTYNTATLNLKEIERQTIINALQRYGNTMEGKKLACRDLGIGIATLYRKIQEYSL